MPTAPDPVPRTTTDEFLARILGELRGIRRALERDQQPAETKPAPAARSTTKTRPSKG